MFKSVKHWFDSLDEEDQQIFHDPDDQVLHVALASLLFHIISADGIESARERRFFSDFLKEECGLSDEQTKHLYDRVRSLDSDLHEDLETIDHYLKDDSELRNRFMVKLSQLIDIDWVKDSELEAFTKALHVFFPDIRDVWTA